MEKKEVVLNIEGIKKLIPHRYPFLLIDKVVSFTKHEAIEAIKNVTVNEEFFNGHFPNMPIMPGVLIVEALAQTSAIFYLLNQGLEESNASVLFMSIDECKFRKPVIPGDILSLRITPLKERGKIVKVIGKAYCDDNLVCEAILTAIVN